MFFDWFKRKREKNTDYMESILNDIERHKQILVAIFETAEVLLEADIKFLKEIKLTDREFANIEITENNKTLFKIERIALVFGEYELSKSTLGENTESRLILLNLIYALHSDKELINHFLGMKIDLEKYLAERAEFYQQEIEINDSIPVPHQGRILWYLFHPLENIKEPEIPKSISEARLVNPIGVFFSPLALIHYINAYTKALKIYFPFLLQELKK